MIWAIVDKSAFQAAKHVYTHPLDKIAQSRDPTTCNKHVQVTHCAGT